MPGGNLGPGNFDPTPLPTDPDMGQVEETVDTISTSTAYRVPKNIRLNAIISNDAPRVKNSLWIKPVEGGFTIYAKFNGKWQPLKMVDDGGTPNVGDDTVQELIGTDQDTSENDTINGAKALARSVGNDIVGTSEDTPEDNTINGAKAFAQSIGNELVGSDTDTANEMSLYGLKAYIDAQIEALDQ